MEKGYDLVSEVNTRKLTWQFKVYVVWVRETPSKNNEEMIGLLTWFSKKLRDGNFPRRSGYPRTFIHRGTIYGGHFVASRDGYPFIKRSKGKGTRLGCETLIFFHLILRLQDQRVPLPSLNSTYSFLLLPHNHSLFLNLIDLNPHRRSFPLHSPVAHSRYLTFLTASSPILLLVCHCCSAFSDLHLRAPLHLLSSPYEVSSIRLICSISRRRCRTCCWRCRLLLIHQVSLHLPPPSPLMLEPADTHEYPNTQWGTGTPYPSRVRGGGEGQIWSRGAGGMSPHLWGPFQINKNRINYVLFGNTVDDVLPYLIEARVEPLIVVLRLLTIGTSSSPRISQVSCQGHRIATDELKQGSVVVKIVDEALNVVKEGDEFGTNNSVEVSGKAIDIKSDIDTQLTLDHVKECVSSKKCKTPSKYSSKVEKIKFAGTNEAET
ncbi:hypothetical protein PIB30_081227 [Stylosanthes scabra]|uniref:Uncharacterized protein n=1 Tax=Stylosanthes scabra TaxID=79078 RepID=A0ABU6RRH6_9FABA|nr:hypothetical protein [Stylosanthes scabra]